MTCPFCGLDFEPPQVPGAGAAAGAPGQERGEAAAGQGPGAAGRSCAACPLHRLACGRHWACCPRCGYKVPLPPRWLRPRSKEPVRGAE